MLKVNQTDKELVLRDFPVMLWLAGLSMAFLGGMLMYYLFGFFYDNPQFFSSDNWGILAGLLISVLSALWGIYLAVKTPITKTVIDSQRETVSVERKNLFNKESNLYKFDEINRTLSLKTTSGDNTRYYSPELNLKNGETVELMAWGLSNKGKCYDIIDLSNKYLEAEADKNAFKLTIINDD
jgi:hypothetical protein